MVRQRRAALAVLCVFAVALSASLFPAGGFGSQPSGVGDTPDPSVDGGVPDETPDGDPQAGSDPTETDDATTSAATATTTDGGAETTTEPATTTEETTESPASESDGAPGGGLLAVLSAALLLLGALAAVGFRTGTLDVSASAAGTLPFTLTVSGTPVGELVGSVPARTMSLVVGLSASVPRIVDDAAALAFAVGGNLSTVAGALARGTGDALRIGARGLGATLGAVPRALAGLGSGASLLSTLSGVSVPGLGRGGRGGSRDRGGGRSKPGDSDDSEEPAPPTVEEAWRAMTERVRLRNPETRTPGEFARAALDRGYPDEAVRKLTDAFREVRYGDLPRTDRTDAARAALDRLRDHWGDRK